MDIYVYKDDGDTRGVCFRFLLCNDGCFICIYLDVLIHRIVLVFGCWSQSQLCSGEDGVTPLDKLAGHCRAT